MAWATSGTPWVAWEERQARPRRLISACAYCPDSPVRSFGTSHVQLSTMVWPSIVQLYDFCSYALTTRVIGRGTCSDCKAGSQGESYPRNPSTCSTFSPTFFQVACPASIVCKTLSRLPQPCCPSWRLGLAISLRALSGRDRTRGSSFPERIEPRSRCQAMRASEPLRLSGSDVVTA